MSITATVEKGPAMAMLTAQEAFDQYREFLKGKGFEVRRMPDGTPCAPGLTAVLDGTSHTVVIVDQPTAAHPSGTVVVFAGPVGLEVVDRLTMSGVLVVWWNGEIWNGSGSAYAAGLTTL